MTNDKGQRYLYGRAAADGKVKTVLRDIGRCDARGDVVLRDQARRTLDDLVFVRDASGRPMYAPGDVLAVARSVFDGAGTR